MNLPYRMTREVRPTTELVSDNENRDDNGRVMNEAETHRLNNGQSTEHQEAGCGDKQAVEQQEASYDGGAAEQRETDHNRGQADDLNSPVSTLS